MDSLTKVDPAEIVVKMAALGDTAERLIRSVVKEASDLNLGQWNVLHAVVTADRALTIGEIEDAVPMSGDITRRVRDLAREEYITKREHPEEYRARLVEPTTRGLSVHETIHQRLREAARDEISKLSERQQGALLAAIGLE